MFRSLERAACSADLLESVAIGVGDREALFLDLVGRGLFVAPLAITNGEGADVRRGSGFGFEVLVGKHAVGG